MFSRQHLEEIRRRRLSRHNRRRFNTTVSLDNSIRMLNASEKNSLDCSSSVAKHFRQMGQHCYYEPRISLPLQPTGGKLSKIVHRRPMHHSSMTSLYANQRAALAKQRARSHSRERTMRCKPFEFKSVPENLKTSSEIDSEECHSLYLPDWLIDRLRPVWSTFENPPPPLTSKVLDQTEGPTYTFKRAMERLRKAKSEANVDLDEIFSNLGLDTTELTLSAPTKFKKQLTNTSREKCKIKSETKELPLRKISNEHEHSSSPLRKRMRHVRDFLDSPLPNTVNHRRLHGRTIQKMVEHKEAKGTALSHARSLSSDSPSHTNRIHTFRHAQGLDMLALELHDSFAKSDTSPLSCVSTLSQTDEHEKVPAITEYRKSKSPEPWLHKRLRNRLDRFNDLDYPSRHESTHGLPKQMPKPDRLNLSLQEEPLFRRRMNLNLTVSGQDNLWITPVDSTSYKSVRFEPHPTRIPISQTPSIIITEQNEQLVPIHPMWDTPDDLKTSNFATFRIS